MLTVHLLRGILGTHDREMFREEWAGQTPRALVARWRKPEWHELDVAICVNGRKLPAEELDTPVDDGADVVLCPDVGVLFGVDFLVIAIAMAVSAAASYAYQRFLVDDLKAPERGDETSQTYAWDGIQTNSGPGFVIPVAFGKHLLGGQVIEISNYAQGRIDDLYIKLALSEGRCQEIGGYTGGTSGEVDDLGGFAFPGKGLLPNNITVNGVLLDSVNPTPGAGMSLRMGEIRQTPVPDGVLSTSNALLILDDLVGAGDTKIRQINDSSPHSRIRLVFDFPEGCYDVIGGNLSNIPVGFDVWIAKQNTNAYAYLGRHTIDFQTPITFRVAATFDIPLPPGSVGPWDVKVRRDTYTGFGRSLSRWRHLIYTIAFGFAYPRLCYLDLLIRANENWSGGNPQVRVLGKWHRVRVIGVTGESAVGIQGESFWEVPTSGQPFFGVWTYPPGRNPAWVALTWAMGTWGLRLTSGQIDTVSWRNFADYCDMTINSEARACCDLVIDKAKSAWETLQQMCRAGRGVPFMSGNVLKVKYEFVDAHGRGSNSVAGLARTQLFISANVEEFQIEYVGSRRRPTVIEAAFLDETKNYEQNSIPVEDPNANLNRQDQLDALPYNKVPVNLYGVTRPSQIRRDILFMHRVNNATKTRITMTVGPEALASELGDVVGVQHDFFQPYDVANFAMRTTSSGTTASLVLDHNITLAPAVTYEVVLRQDDQTVATRTITSVAGSYPAGSTLTLSSSVTVKRGASVAFGRQAKVVKDYKIISIGLAEKLKRSLILVEHIPSVHTEPAAADYGDDELPAPYGGSEDFLPTTAPTVSDVRLHPSHHRGVSVITWYRDPVGPQAGVRKARVFARTVGATAWQALGDTETEALATTLLEPGVTYEIRVLVATSGGLLGPEGGEADATVSVPEFAPFPPPACFHPTATVMAQSVRITWDAIDLAEFEYYEIRRGHGWVTGEVLYRGTEPAFDWLNPTGGAHSFHVRARAKSGLYSPTWTVVGVVWTNPNGTTLITSSVVDELASAPAGTLTDLTYDSGSDTLEISAGKLRGTYETPVYDATVVAHIDWNCTLDTRQVDTVYISELTEACGSGEMLWRTIDARDPSARNPGVDFLTTIDQLGGVVIADLPPDLLVGGRSGQLGDRTRAMLEVQYDTTGAGAWTAWLPFKRERRTAQKFKLRVTMHRADLGTQLYATQLTRSIVF